MATTKVIPEVTDLNATSSTNGLKMPTGGAYSGTPTDGMMRNDTTGSSQGSASTMQHYNGTEWKNFENLSNGFTADYLVVAGGGGGGFLGGGGGAGGYLTSTNYTLTSSTQYIVQVGAGGAGSTDQYVNALNGANSIFNNITSIGGGGGGSHNSTLDGNNGGSGGGGNSAGGNDPELGGSGTLGQGNDGGDGSVTPSAFGSGGGGGAGTSGGNGTGTSSGNGGNGLYSSITGSSVARSGGGGGGVRPGATGGIAGVGGGGTGSTVIGTNGQNNTGGGAGGGGYDGTILYSGGNGGSGIVILRYPTAEVSSYAVTGTLDTTTDTAYPIANTAYYKLNGDALDSSGNGYNGTASNVTWGEGRFGPAGDFKTLQGNIITPVGVYNNSFSGHSVSFWMYSGGTNYETPIKTRTSTSAAAGWSIRTGAGGNGINWSFSNSAGAVVFVSGELSFTFTDGWHHVVASWDGTTNANGAKLYIDGSLFDQRTANATLASQTFTLGITLGADRQSSGRSILGLDQVRIFNTALSAANVTSLYNEAAVNESTDGTDSILQFIGGTGTVTFS